MHEVSIAQGILDIIIESSKKNGFKKVNSVYIRVGVASGVVVESLRFAFDIVKKDTLAEGAELLIEEIPLGGHCINCNQEFITDETYILECPHCGSLSFKLTKGRELEIIELDVEDI